VDTWSRLAIFAIVENNHGIMNNWRPGGILYVDGVVTIVILSVSIKDRTVVGTSVEIERMPLT
jgi:hypothetical protein